MAAFALGACRPGVGTDLDDRPPTHEYTIALDSLRMRDGVWLAVTWWIPTPRTPGERFPALLELLPYRKDDDFYARDFPLYDWFARRGFLMAKVDVRGTGGSTGALPAREYSEEELADAVELIAALGADPRGNGRVGMWGISWSGFNAMQVALRQPPALGAILAVHASDDLFHDDVRYIDGVLHLDRYAVQIDHGNGLPRTPGYALDSAYFADRFDRRPWILTYLAQQEDGDFWRANALRYRRDELRVPAYFIGGLLDGYRDTPIRALAHQQQRIRDGANDSTVRVSPLKVEIGPWNHSWPDNGTPGPNYEWRVRAAQWWDRWLRDRPSDLMKEPPLLVFQREAHAPDAELGTTPGRWRYEDWPVFRGRLVSLPFTTPRADPSWGELRYAPSVGTAAGEWWGETTGDMTPDDERSITIDFDPDGRPLVIVGMPRVTLVVRHGAPLAHWVARLESVSPDGRSALITGGAINVAHRRGTMAPARAVVGAVDTLVFDLHFTTWTLPPGHRLRLALGNAQFPMLWPTPYAMTSAVDLASSRLELPGAPDEGPYKAPRLPAPQPRARRPDVTALADSSAGPIVTRDSTGRTEVRWYTAGAWSKGATRFDEREEETYAVRDDDPAGATFSGRKSHRIAIGSRIIEVVTRIEVLGSAEHLDVTVTRDLSENGRPLRHKEWRERIPRRWH